MKRLSLVLCILWSATSFAQDGLIVASGFGAADLTKVPLEQQAQMMAKRAAKVDAQRNLIEQIKGLRLTSGTTMEDFEVSSDIVATRAKGILQGAFEFDTNVSKEGDAILAEVKMAICIDNSASQCKDKITLSDILLKHNDKS